MRPETIAAWMLIGVALLTIAMLLALWQVTEGGKLSEFLTATGLVYFTIGIVLGVMHGRHIGKRVQARGE